MPRQRRGLGAVLVGVAEDTDRVEPRLDEEPLELGDVGLGLTGEADDHVGADAGARRQGARLGEESEEVLAVAVPSHPPEHRTARVLDRQVEVRRDARVSR